jgi:dTDP-4-amino-4,6-dideoxygalactose transaminase
MKKKLKIPFAKVPVNGNEFKYVKEVLESGWLTTAGKAAEFEKKFAQSVNAKYACVVNSCTSALHLGLEALGVQPGAKVFVQSMTFTASAEIIRYLDADPVFLDIEYGSNLITPQILQDAIKKHPEVKHLVIVHFGGHPAPMTIPGQQGILDICRENGIKILEDAAHAFPTRLNGKMIGSFGDITCFSFYANKTITTGEGGMLTTNNKELYARVKTMRLHGINRDIWDRFTSEIPTWEYDVVEAGFKYNMPDINAAIGLAQLEKAEEFRNEREKAAAFYFHNLSGLSMLDLPLCKVPFEDHSWHLFPIVLNDKSSVFRNEFITKMSEAGIGTSVHYKPLHRMTYYRQKYNLKPEDFPNTEKTWLGNVSLPIFPYMSHDELIYVTETIKKITGFK